MVFARLGKGLIVSPRPAAEIDNTLMHMAGEKLELVSMPSGHTLTAFAVATSLYFAIDAPRRRSFLWLWLIAALVGLSRIAVGAHWAGDVAVGAGLGILAGLMGHVLLQRVDSSYLDPKGWRLRCVAAALVFTVYTLVTDVLDFEENTVVQRMLAMLAATMLVVFIRQNLNARRR
jgi:membrane-associated phospholipid phosphatase